jgi:hypothetical protein
MSDGNAHFGKTVDCIVQNLPSCYGNPPFNIKEVSNGFFLCKQFDSKDVWIVFHVHFHSKTKY